MTAAGEILVSRCGTCHGRFLPRQSPCPYCGSRDVTPEGVPSEGRVLAATGLENPATGWAAPHRLVLVELAQAVRLLAVAPGALPAIDDLVRIERDAAVYRVVEEVVSAPGQAERGEGDAPATGRSRPPFEPPR